MIHAHPPADFRSKSALRIDFFKDALLSNDFGMIVRVGTPAEKQRP